MPHPPRPDLLQASPDLMREALEAFEAYTDASPSDRQRLLEEIATSRPQLAGPLHQLIANDRTHEDLLDRPAVQLLAHQNHSLRAESTLDHATSTAWARLLPRSAFTWCLLSAIALTLFLFLWCLLVFARFGNATDDDGWVASLHGAKVYVTQVEPGGRADGSLRVGDQITGFNGHTEDLYSGLFSNRSVSSGGRYQVDGMRDRKPFSVTLSLGRRVVPHLWADQLLLWAVSLCFALAGSAIGLLKPHSKVTRLAAFALLAESLVLLTVTTAPYAEFVGPASVLFLHLLELVSPIHFALAYHFYAAFFDDLHGVRRRRPTLPILYVTATISVLTLQLMLHPRSSQALSLHPSLIQALLFLRHTFFLVAPTCICILLLWHYLRYRGQPGQQRARWIVFGSFFGIFPYGCYRLALSLALLFGLDVSSAALASFYHWTIVASIAVPASAAYAVLKHRVFDIHVIIRRSLRYILLTRVLQLLLLLPVCGILVSLALNKDRTVADLLGHNLGFLTLLLCVFVLLAFRTRLQRLVDRRYGRDAAARAEAVLAARTEVRRASTPETLAAALAQQVQSMLDPATLLLFFAPVTGAILQRVAASPAPPVDLNLHTGSPLLQHLEFTAAPQPLAALPEALSHTESVLQMRQFGASLVSPLVTSRHVLVGLLLLGEPDSGDGFTSEDLLLLRSLSENAAQTLEALLLEKELREQRTLSSEAELRWVAERDSSVLECPTCGLCFGFPQTICSVDNSSLLRNRSISRVIRDHYQLERRIDSGGMGTVYQARDLHLQRTVAIKIIVPPISEHPGNWIGRAEREGQSLARLSHPNIVAAYDFGVHEQGAAYLVMEFVNGKTLRRVLESSRATAALAAIWFDQILDGLAAAHTAGIIHRDLKPENIMITNSAADPGASSVKVLDFGIARLVSGESESGDLTLTGSRIGTPRYMSPEQLAGAALDQRSDLFSSAVILVELLTGELPLRPVSLVDRSATLFHNKGCIPVSTEKDLLLNNLLEACLSFAPEHRPGSAAELRQQLIPLLRSYRGTHGTASESTA